VSGERSPVALVTGAGRGIGRALARGLSADGFAVGLLGRDPASLEDAVAGLAGPTATVPADVTDERMVARALDVIESQLGQIDVLVNNAGRIDAVEVPLWESDPDDWWGVVETNLRGPFLLAQLVAPRMVERGNGRIVTVSTGSALRDSDVYSAYAVSKAAALRLSGCLHVALAPRGVHVFDVAPGVVRTDMTASMPVHADRTEWTEVERVAAFVVRLARGDADGLAGRLLRVDTDDLDDLLARIPADDLHARRLRLHPYAPTDPLLPR